MNGASMRTRPFAIALATIGWCGVLLQCYLTLKQSFANGKTLGDGLWIFLSYFTVLTNLLVCTSLTAALTSASSTIGKACLRPTLTTGLATSIVFVGLGYHFLLRNSWNPQGMQWVADVLLHYVVPVLYVIYWWLDSRKAPLRWTQPLIWSAYPAAYLAYALIRGSILGSYPYAFIDVSKIGYSRTMLNSVGLLLVFLGLGLTFVALGRLRTRARA